MGRSERKTPRHKIRDVVGGNLKRLLGGRSAEAVASKAYMDRRTLNRICNGEVATTLDNIGHLADALGAKPNALLVDRGPMVGGQELPMQAQDVKKVTRQRKSGKK